MAHFFKYKVKRIKKKNFSRTSKIGNNPQLKGLVMKVVIVTPKKPNSAIRNVAKATLYKNKKKVRARITGSGYLPTKYNRILVEGGRANDLPGIRHTMIRGVYDAIPLVDKIRRRSIYGVSRPPGYTKFVRRCFRHITYV